jgi:hypothetical protein
VEVTVICICLAAIALLGRIEEEITKQAGL